MRSLEEMLRENHLGNPDDIDALPELAEIVGVLIRDEWYPDIGLLINYAIGNEYDEAFSWIMAAMQGGARKKRKAAA